MRCSSPPRVDPRGTLPKIQNPNRTGVLGAGPRNPKIIENQIQHPGLWQHVIKFWISKFERKKRYLVKTESSIGLREKHHSRNPHRYIIINYACPQTEKNVFNCTRPSNNIICSKKNLTCPKRETYVFILEAVSYRCIPRQPLTEGEDGVLSWICMLI